MFKVYSSNPNFFLRAKSSRFWGRFVDFDLRAFEGLEHAVRDAVIPLLTFGTTSKLTGAGRFAELDEMAASLLRSEPGRLPVYLHDCAVSSGVTACEFFSLLRTRGIPVVYHVSDKFAELRVFDGVLGRIENWRGEFVRTYVCGVVFDPASHPALFLSRWGGALFRARRSVPTREGRRVLLFCEAMRALIERGDVVYFPCDLFVPETRFRFDFIRCMNVLNLSYFDESAIRRALVNLAGTLAEGGLLQVGRTDAAGVNRVGFHRWMDGRWTTLEAVNGGAEIAPLLEDWSC